MYCQSCGAQNPDDARFCNMCGARIAAPGTPGGMIASATAPGVANAGAPQGTSGVVAAQPPSPAPAPAAPAGASAGNVWAEHDGGGRASASMRTATPPHPMGYAPQSGGPSMSSVSLHAIGVQSSRKTWTVIVAIAIALVAIGAVGAWLAMQGGERSEPVADAEPATPMEIGMPLPEGAEPPDVDFVSGGVRVTDQPQAGSGTKRTGGGGGGGTTTIGASSSGGTTGTTTGSGGAGGGAGGAGAGGASASAGGSAGGGGSGSGSAGGSGSGSGGGSGGGSGSGSGSGTGSGTASGTGTGDVPAGGTIPEGDLPEERDIALEMYASRVRFVIRRYYATRAQSCFDRATRNDPDLRGTVVVRFTIGSDGAVSGSSTIRNSTGNSELGACLANQVRSWRLPAPPGGDLTLEMPFSN